MYTVRVKDGFCAAHRLNDYQGQCESLHGHNWKVEVTICGEYLQPNGLLVDFTIVKKILRAALSELDHKMLNEMPEFAKLNPTSENIARTIYNRFSNHPELGENRVTQVTVWESDNACASYIE